MKAAVVVFPGSNCDRDLAVALKHAGADVTMVWHKVTDLPAGLDFVGIPGGFSFGDYLRCGAIAARSPICRSIIDFAGQGGYVLGICNGFQILTETGLLPGALLRNAALKYICKPVELEVRSTQSVYTEGYRAGQTITVPIAHHDGNYTAAPETRAALADQDRIALAYTDNPNGSDDDIAGILSENRRVLGMMPHPERMAEPAHGCEDGAVMFRTLINALIPA